MSVTKCDLRLDSARQRGEADLSGWYASGGASAAARSGDIKGASQYEPVGKISADHRDFPAVVIEPKARRCVEADI